MAFLKPNPITKNEKVVEMSEKSNVSIKIILADDHKIVREGLRFLIENQPDMELVGEAGNGRRAAQLVRELSPDVVIMDIAMPELNGVEATRQITAEFPHVKVIALTMHSDRQYVVEILKAGGSGYLLKDYAFEDLVSAIRMVIAGKIYLCPGIADIVLKDYVQHLSTGPTANSPTASGLSNREREVLQLLAEGKATKDVASILHVSVKTIETHRQHIMSKLDLRSIAELTKYAVREGLTSL